MHIPYDSVCDILKKKIRMFLKPHYIESTYGSDLPFDECRNVKLQLADKEILISGITLKALRDLTAGKQKSTLLGMQSFLEPQPQNCK